MTYRLRFRSLTALLRIRLAVAALVLLGLAAPLQAACFADYRAKMDNPLRLHYGVVEITDTACEIEAVTPVIDDRIAAGGWELLEVISVFDEDGLASRRADAAEFYLAF